MFMDYPLSIYILHTLKSTDIRNRLKRATGKSAYVRRFLVELAVSFSLNAALAFGSDRLRTNRSTKTPAKTSYVSAESTEKIQPKDLKRIH